MDPVERSLELVAERVGDPAPLIYARLFEVMPEVEPLFVADTTGAVRGEMLAVVFQCLLEPRGVATTHLVRAERSNHGDWGVKPEDFARFFPILMEVCREALGADWTLEVQQAWDARLELLGA